MSKLKNIKCRLNSLSQLKENNKEQKNIKKAELNPHLSI